MLLTLIALQSVLVAAEVHQPHQQQPQHQSVAEDHDVHVSRIEHVDNADTQQSVTFDKECQHCCHCHGGVLMLLSAGGYWLVRYSNVLFSNDLSVPPSSTVAVNLRPPIV